jgi:hypothetical protein
MNKIKLLFLILGANPPVFKSLVNEGGLKTWATLKNENMEIYPYYGGHERNEIVDGELWVTSSDGNIPKKTLDAFEFAYNNLEFDYLVRPNVSTYVRLDKLYELLETKPRERYHAGHLTGGLVDGHTQVKYPSGLCMIYSRDLIEMIAKNREQANFNPWADDLCVGKFLQDQHIPLDHIEAAWFHGQWPETEILHKLFTSTKEDLDKYILFRCKTEISHNDITKRNDIHKMKFIHKVLYG